MKIIKVVCTNDLIEMLFRSGNTINAFVIKGVPEDAKLVECNVDIQREEATMVFHTTDESCEDHIDIQWGKDNRIACIEQEINRQTFEELCVTPKGCIQKISEIVNDKTPDCGD